MYVICRAMCARIEKINKVDANIEAVRIGCGCDEMIDPLLK